MVNIFAQKPIGNLNKDIDNDKIVDTICLNKNEKENTVVILVKLSTQNYIPIKSKIIEAGSLANITSTKNGFAYKVDNMRYGFQLQFRYNTQYKKIQLIGISNYSYGGATLDGSGSGSANLLTNYYIGNWKYYDYNKKN